MAPSIVSITPQDGDTGVARLKVIEVLFDQEMDHDSLENGGFALATQASNVLTSGPTSRGEAPEIGEDPLYSGSFEGLVEGSFSFVAIDNDSTDEYTGDDDTTGDGSLWRTKLQFTPTYPLSSGVQYTVLLSSNISTRTTYTVVKTPSTADGNVIVGGPYTGTGTHTVYVTITEGGARGTAKYTWRVDSGEESDEAYTSRYAVAFDDGITAKFSRGTYVAGDVFSFVVKVSDTLDDIYGWSFTSATGEPASPPSETVTTVIEALVEGETTVDGGLSASDFYVEKAIPANGSAHLPLTTDTIILYFSDDIDADTVDEDSVILEVVAVDGDPDIDIPDGGEPDYTLTVSGAQLTISFGASATILYNNNAVQVLVTDDVQSTSGITVAQYSYYFTTVYSPLYIHPTQIYTKVGSIIGNDFPEDILYRLLYRYSKHADVLNFTSVDTATSTTGSTYWKYVRGEWIICMAVRDLLLNQSGASSNVQKKLADLSIKFGGNANVKDALQDAERCVADFEPQLKSGGTVEGFHCTGGIKGAHDADQPILGRDWVGDMDNGRHPYVNADLFYFITGTSNTRGIRMGSHYARRKRGYAY